jgi:Cu+-exporting ATPase
VSFAIGAGARRRHQSADVTLMRDDLMSVVDAITLSRCNGSQDPAEPLFCIRLQRAWHTTRRYGLLNPVIAGAAMALSSVSVVSNSLLLKRWKAARSTEWKPSHSASKA